MMLRISVLTPEGNVRSNLSNLQKRKQTLLNKYVTYLCCLSCKAILILARVEVYHGERARYLYFQCLQVLLRMQIETLVELWRLPAEFEVCLPVPLSKLE